jgi:hypothetical protein
MGWAGPIRPPVSRIASGSVQADIVPSAILFSGSGLWQPCEAGGEGLRKLQKKRGRRRLEPLEKAGEVGCVHGRAARRGGVRMIPDVEENAGTRTWLLVPVVADNQSEPVDSASWNHVLRTAPVGLDGAAVDDAVVVAGPGVVDAGVVTGHGDPWPSGGTRILRSRAEGGAEGEKTGG